MAGRHGYLNVHGALLRHPLGIPDNTEMLFSGDPHFTSDAIAVRWRYPLGEWRDLEVSFEFLARALLFPPGMEVLAASRRQTCGEDGLCLRVSHPDLPAHEEGEALPLVELTYRREGATADTLDACVLDGWNWEAE